MTGDGFDPVAWAIAEAGITVGEAVRRILTVPGGMAVGSPPPRRQSTPTSKRGRLVEFVNDEYEITARDVVNFGITDSMTDAYQMLGAAARDGQIDRLRTGVYGPKGSSTQEMGS